MPVGTTSLVDNVSVDSLSAPLKSNKVRLEKGKKPQRHKEHKER
jgi:hypothetical protein